MDMNNYVIAVFVAGFAVGFVIGIYTFMSLKTGDWLWLTGRKPLQPLATDFIIIGWEEPNKEMRKTTKGMDGNE